MRGIRGYRRTERERPRVIREGSSVEDLIVIEKPKRPFCISLDVGRARDYSPMIVMSLDPTVRPYPVTFHRIEIAPHGTSALTLADNVHDVQTRLREAGHFSFAAIDATGIGAATAEHVTNKSPLTVAVEITGDGRVIPDKYVPYRFKVPKRELVDSIVSAMQQRSITIASTVRQEEREEFLRQLSGFSRILAPNKDGSAKVTFGNDTSIADHDDIVSSASIGLWALNYLADQGYFGGWADPDTAARAGAGARE